LRFSSRARALKLIQVTDDLSQVPTMRELWQAWSRTLAHATVIRTGPPQAAGIRRLAARQP
jgi:hypothetical protein